MVVDMQFALRDDLAELFVTMTTIAGSLIAGIDPSRPPTANKFAHAPE
jgi:hypothetical protein